MLDFNDDNKCYQSPFPPLSDKLSFRVAERKLSWHNERTGENVGITKQKAIVREAAGGGTWLANVGENYKLLLNTDLFPHIEQHIADTMLPQYLRDVEVREHTSYNGRDCWREYVFPHLTCDLHGEGDVAYRCIVGNSYGAKAVTLLSGAIDFFCTNGMVIGQSEKQARKHTSGLSIIGLDNWITDSIGQFASHAARIQKYAETYIDFTKQDGLFKYLVVKGLLSERRAKEACAGMYSECEKRTNTVGGTHASMWHLYSALTDWASHSDVRDTGNDHEANTRIQRQQHAERVIRAAEQFVEA